MGNDNLTNAKHAKDDEFYTPLSCVIKELEHYDFSGKSVFCPCDNPVHSNFVRYFVENKSRLGVVGLTCNYKKGGGLEGSFNSSESFELASKADIIVTNPPFSKFGLFVDFLLATNKKFLVLGSNRALTNKKVYTAFYNGKLRGGYNCGIGVDFTRPDGSTKSVPVTWYTNLPVRANTLPFTTGRLMKDCPCKHYDGREDIMYLDTYKDYPDDYDGWCAVPLHSFYRYSREHFNFMSWEDSINFIAGGYVGGVKKSFRVVVSRKK